MANTGSSAAAHLTKKRKKGISTNDLLTGFVPLCTEEFDFSKMKKITWEEAEAHRLASIKKPKPKAKASQ